MNSIKEQFSYALPLGLSSIVLLLFTHTDKYIITHYRGSSAFAIYSVGAFQVPFVNIIRGSVTNITDFGVFIELAPGVEGLCHISELEHGRVETVEDVVKMGDMVKVKVIGVDDNGASVSDPTAM